MNKKNMLLPVVAGMACMSVAAQEKMNIVFILADDLGIGDLGCYGQTRIKTPNLDWMAENGMVFTQHYSGAAVSAPSRCSFLTGLHTGHSQVRSLPGFTASGRPVDLRPEDTTVAQVLKDAGYATAVIGKWGMAEAGMESMPCRKGFDYFFGYKTHGDAHHYYPEYLWRNGEKVFFPENDTDNTTGEYSNDLFTEEALAYIDRHATEGPFFLYLPYCIPHYEITVPDDSKEQYRDLGWEERRLSKGHYRNDPDGNVSYAGMVSRLDRYVGQIISALKKNGIDKNTMVIFSSDNGKEYDNGFFNSNMGLRGQKRELYEGGIRAPLIVYAPGTVPSGVESDHISAFWDFYPTFAEMAGVEVEGTDGISMLPVLTGKGNQKPHQYLYWETNMKQGPIQAVRYGKWKAVRFLDKPLELYDLSSDPAEKTDVSESYPEVVSEISRILAEARTPHPEYPMDRWVYKKPVKGSKSK